MPKPLPPLNSIRAFEVAARHLNFSRAGEELSVTQGAISKQILLLEDYIGIRLFERLPGGLELTHEGQILKNAISPAFETLHEAFYRFSRRSPRSNICRISTLGSFAAHFIVPRLDRLEQLIPHVNLELLTSDRIVDFDREEIDLSVRYGAGIWDGVVAHKLTDGFMLPVCAPALLEQHDGHLEQLAAQARRIQVFSNDEWRKWSHMHDIDLDEAPHTFIVEDFFVAIRAVLAGQGLALLPEILVRDLVNSGHLALFTPEKMAWHKTYYIVHAPNAERRPIVRDVIDWLVNEVRDSEKISAEKNSTEKTSSCT